MALLFLTFDQNNNWVGGGFFPAAGGLESLYYLAQIPKFEVAASTGEGGPASHSESGDDELSVSDFFNLGEETVWLIQIPS